jgi:hypothetical protein
MVVVMASYIIATVKYAVPEPLTSADFARLTWELPSKFGTKMGMRQIDDGILTTL